MRERTTRSHRLATFATAILGSLASLGAADTVCAWNFNLDSENQTVFKADHGIGIMDATTSAEWVRSYAGTNLGVFADDEAGASFGLRGDAANGSGFELAFSAVGDHVLQFAYRSTTTGFHECEIQRLTPKGWQTISDFGDSETAAEWSLIMVPLSDLSGETRLRLMLDGATSSSSTARFDNMRVSSIPAPATVVALGEFALLGVRGRRGPDSTSNRD